MLIQAGVITIEDNCIHIDKFTVTQETTLKEARLLALDWAADEIKEAITSEKGYDYEESLVKKEGENGIGGVDVSSAR